MRNPWLILATATLITSFSIGFLITGDFGVSLMAGVLSLLTGIVTAAMVNWYRNHAVDQHTASLKQQIRQLQRVRAEEQQAIAEITAEKERVALSLNSVQDELRQRQLPGTNPYARPALSWNLGAQVEESIPAAIAPDVEAEIQPEFQPASLNQFIAEAAETKQKITASLNHLQSEFNHLNAQVAEQRQVRERLLQEIKHLSQQQQQLAATTTSMTQEIAELERCRNELDQYVVYVETKKQELEAGTNPLQKALQQLQGQVNALQDELRSLEAQVTTKRREKETLERDLNQSQPAIQPAQVALRQVESQKAQLEQELMQLRQAQKQAIAQQTTLQAALSQLEHQKTQLERELANLRQQHAQTKTVQADLQALEQQKSQLGQNVASLQQQQAQLKSTQDHLQKVEKQLRDRRQEKESLERQITQLQAQKTSLRQPQTQTVPLQQDLDIALNAANGGAKAAMNRPVPRPKAQPVEGTPPEPESELSELWTELMVELPEYELQALKAIAQENDPTRILNRISQDNFTTPDEIINSINQLAAEIVGERVIKARGTAPPIIMRDHQRTIKKLIETYEYLTE